MNEWLCVCYLQEVYLRRGKVLFQSSKVKAVESLVSGLIARGAPVMKAYIKNYLWYLHEILCWYSN